MAHHPPASNAVHHSDRTSPWASCKLGESWSPDCPLWNRGWIVPAVHSATGCRSVDCFVDRYPPHHLAKPDLARPEAGETQTARQSGGNARTVFRPADFAIYRALSASR